MRNNPCNLGVAQGLDGSRNRELLSVGGNVALSLVSGPPQIIGARGCHVEFVLSS